MMEIQLIRATVKDADDFENTSRIICGTIKNRYQDYEASYPNESVDKCKASGGRL